MGYEEYMQRKTNWYHIYTYLKNDRIALISNGINTALCGGCGHGELVYTDRENKIQRVYVSGTMTVEQVKTLIENIKIKIHGTEEEVG